MFTMDDLFEMAVKLEKNGEAIYRKAFDKISKKELKDLLLWMAGEEEAHGRWFSDQQKRLSLDPEEKRLKEMVPDALTAMMGDRALSLEDIDFKTLSSPPALLEIFCAFEQETIRFYEILAMFIEDDPVQKGLEKIIREENRHVEKLTAMMASL